MATDAKTYLDDPQSLVALVEAMPPPERAEYKSYGALTLESAFPGRKMVVYTCSEKGPLDIEVISFGDFRVDWETGPSFEIFTALGTTQMLAVPKRLRPRDVFFQVPQTFTLKYKGRQQPKHAVDFVSAYAVLVKTRSKEIHQVPGHTYAVTLNNFRERHPDLKLRY